MSDAETPKAELRELLERRAAEFHELVDGLSAADFERKIPGSRWKVRQMAWHIPFGFRFVPGSVESIRKGKDSGPPAWLINAVEPAFGLLPLFGARGATPQSVGAELDRQNAIVLELLDGVQDEEWSQSARALGELYTLAKAFEACAEHTEEHLEDLRRALG